MEVCTLASKLSRQGYLGPAIIRHPGVSKVGQFGNVRVVPRMYVKLGVPSTSISRWVLNISRCL